MRGNRRKPLPSAEVTSKDEDVTARVYDVIIPMFSIPVNSIPMRSPRWRVLRGLQLLPARPNDKLYTEVPAEVI